MGSGTGRGVGFEKYRLENRQGSVTGVRGQREGAPGMGGWVAGHITDGAPNEECWKFPGLSKCPWVSSLCHRLSAEVAEQQTICSGGSQAGWKLTRAQAQIPLDLLLSPLPRLPLRPLSTQVYAPPATLYTWGRCPWESHSTPTA